MGSSYKAGQRWISETEPELGLGTISSVANRCVRISFAASEQERCYAEDNAPLFRVEFKVGDELILHGGIREKVKAVTESEGLLYYQLDSGETVCETALSAHIGFSKPDDRLCHAKCDHNDFFELRRQARQLYYEFRGSRCCGLAGARMELLGHQLYVADKVVSMTYPRVLLADEVGLGKTIEAGLILHRLLMVGRVERVLILLPDTLIHQWFVELLRRFNLKFNIFDEDRCISIEDTLPNGNPFDSEQLVIVGMNYLLENSDRAEQVLESKWDLLIVDEAHHLHWTETAAGKDYCLVEALSKMIKSVLLLTATPEQLGLESHFARLRLLDPQRYASMEEFSKEMADYHRIAGIARRIIGKETLSRDEEETILARNPGDARLKQLIEHYRKNPADSEVLLQELIDLYGVGRNIFRNTRSAIPGFPQRHLNLYELETTEDIASCAQEFWADAGEMEEPTYAYQHDARVAWLGKLIRETDEKVLVICHTKQRAMALEEALKSHTGALTTVFHEDLSIVQRDRNAAWFGEPTGAQVLICSEIGSEGRNFQFAYHLVLFDLPLQPEALEQRIGRLARLGQTETVQIHVPFIPDTPQALLTRWYHEGINAFEEISEGGWQLAEEFMPQLKNLIKKQGSKRSVDTFLKKCRARTLEIKSILEEGRDCLLEMNSYHPEKAQVIIDEIIQQESGTDVEQFMLKSFDCFGVSVEPVSQNTYAVKPGDLYADAFPMLEEEGGHVTFNRKKALLNENWFFMTREHPMCVGAMDWTMNSEKGNSSCAHWPCNETVAIYLESYFVLQCIAPAQWTIGRFLPPTPIRVLLDHTCADLTQEISAQTLYRVLENENPGWLVEKPRIKQDILPKLIDAARKLAEKKVPAILAVAEEKARQLYAYEIERAEALASKGAMTRDEVEEIKETAEGIIQAIHRSVLSFDAVRIIWRGKR